MKIHTNGSFGEKHVEKRFLLGAVGFVVGMVILNTVNLLQRGALLGPKTDKNSYTKDDKRLLFGV